MCARIGDQTTQGHILNLLYFWRPPDISGNGDIAFLAREGPRRAWRRESGRGYYPEGNSSPREVARGNRRRSRQAALSARASADQRSLTRVFGNLIAFTNRNVSTTSAYIAGAGRLSRSLRTGTQTGLGTLTYISNGRPGLLSDGTCDHNCRIEEPVCSFQGQGRRTNAHRGPGRSDPVWHPARGFRGSLSDISRVWCAWEGSRRLRHRAAVRF